MNNSLVVFYTLIIWDISFGCETRSNDQESSLYGTSIRCLDNPFGDILVEFGASDNCFEGSVFAEIADFVDMVEIGLQLPPIWVVGCKCPGVVYLRDVELVDGDRAVNSRTWVAIPSPVVKSAMISNDVPMSAYAKERVSRSDIWTHHVPPKPRPASYKTVLYPCLRIS
jgi:hypothetical protein